MPDEEKNKNSTCPSCNEGVKAHWKRCPACDTPLSGTRTPTPAPVDATIGDGKTIVTPGGGAGTGTVSLLDRYELLDEIGRGGMGVVYKARQTDLDRIVAVKRILPESGSASMVSRFRSERNTIAKLNHQNILTVYDAGEDDKGPWLAMEYVEGGRTLKDRMKEGALPEEEVLSLGLCLCRALSCAHREGIIHRDVKPTNVLIDRDGTPKLADFGLAREGRGSDLSVTGYGMGTMAYAAPEQLRDAKGVDHRVDIYGLGALLCHLATGESPRTIRESAIPVRFRSVLLKALSERPGDRYFSVDEMAKALEGAADQATAPVAAVSGEVCPNPDCGVPTPEGEKYCDRCGTGLYEKCPRPGCDNEVRVGKAFCGKCGLDIPAWRKADEHLATAKEHEMTCRWGEAAEACRASLKVFPNHEAARELLKKMEKAAEMEIAGFARLREETFSCGGQTHTVAIYEHEKTGLEFVLVPGGSFKMGSPSGESHRRNNERQHTVKVNPFLICRTVCTQEAWDRIGGDDRRRWRGTDLPIDGVSWDDCTAWCKKAGLRLPSEAEWEYACRAGTTGRFYFGNSESNLGLYAWYYRNSRAKTHPVGQKTPNAFGLYDMHGNVWEWCQDWYVSDYDKTPPDGTAYGRGGSFRVSRGGSWCFNDCGWRSAGRGRIEPGVRRSTFCFRPASCVF